MADNGWVRTLLASVLVLAVAALLLGQALGQPMLLGYVTTDSMEPALSPGDGFVAVPAAVAGPVETGDVVVFRAEELHGGGLTTHRVVGETDRGYVTRGDANAFTDQDSGEPPVRDEQVVAKALQIDGHVIVVPGLGTAATAVRDAAVGTQRFVAAATGIGAFMGPNGFLTLFFLASVVIYVAGVARERKTRIRGRSRSRDDGVDPRVVVGLLTALLVISATAAMVVPSGPTPFGIYSTETELDDSSRPSYVPTGESRTNEIGLTNGGFVPVVVFLEPGEEGTAVRPREVRLDGREQANVTATFSAPPETGYYRRYVVEHRYLAVLPSWVIRRLYAVHPWLPIVAIDALLGGAFYLGGRAVVGSGRLAERVRDRELPVWTRVKRVTRRLY